MIAVSCRALSFCAAVVAQAAQDALLKRAKANSLAQLGKYDPASEDESAGDRTYEKNYVY